MLKEINYVPNVWFLELFRIDGNLFFGFLFSVGFIQAEPNKTSKEGVFNPPFTHSS